MTHPYLLETTTWHDVRNAEPPSVVVLPWGATEPHNLHLPYTTDNILTERVAAEAGRLARERGATVMVLPVMPFGVNTGQLALPLTINMNPSTQHLVLRDVLDSLGRHRVAKVAVLNGHGGNDFRQMIRELQPAFPDMFLCVVNWYRTAPWEAFFEDRGDHAGEMETSLMLHVAPHLVRPLAEAGPGVARHLALDGFRQGWAWAPRDWPLVTADTGVGDPRKATSEKGRRFFEAVTGAVAEFLVSLAAAEARDLYR
jgi:creatinine amidohydrolase